MTLPATAPPDPIPRVTRILARLCASTRRDLSPVARGYLAAQIASAVHLYGRSRAWEQEYRRARGRGVY